MNCPHCDYRIRVLALTEHSELNENFIAPLVCEKCLEISLLVGAMLRKIEPSEMDAIKRSPAWMLLQDAIAVLREQRMRANALNN